MFATMLIVVALLVTASAGPLVRGLTSGSSVRDTGVRGWLLVAATGVCAVSGPGIRPGMHAPVFLWFAVAGVALAVIDAETLRLPNRIVVPGWVFGAVLLGAESLRTGHPGRALTALLASAAFFGILLIAVLMSPSSMGMGDVKLAGLVALLLGWSGWDSVVLGMGAGMVLAAGAGLLLVVTGRLGPRDPLPFGPFLIGGAWLAMGAG